MDTIPPRPKSDASTPSLRSFPPMEWMDLPQWMDENKDWSEGVSLSDPKGIRLRFTVPREGGVSEVMDLSAPIFEPGFGEDENPFIRNLETVKEVVKGYENYLAAESDISDEDLSAGRVEVATISRRMEFQRRRSQGLESHTPRTKLEVSLKTYLQVGPFHLANAKLKAAKMDEKSIETLMADGHLVRDRIKQYVDKLVPSDPFYDTFEKVDAPRPSPEIIDRFVDQLAVAQVKDRPSDVIAACRALHVEPMEVLIRPAPGPR